MLYKICKFCSKSILRSLYFNLFDSHMTYGLPVWGNAHVNNINRIKILQKKAVRAITNSDYTAHTSPLFKELNILKFDDQFDNQTSSLLWDLDHDEMPEALSSYFTPINEIHRYETRLAASNMYLVKNANTLHGRISFQINGTKILNDLKNTELYNNSWNKQIFLKALKKSVIDHY